MNLDRVGSGNLPEEINVIVEIPSHSEPVKYEVDKNTGAMFVSRFMNTAMYYPCNYGYIPQTLAADGDPVDVLIVTPVPLISGAVIQCRPIGVLIMKDESGNDEKILAIPVDKLCTQYRHIKNVNDVPEMLLKQIQHFFTHYKDLEEGKWVEISGWDSIEKAQELILLGKSRTLTDPMDLTYRPPLRYHPPEIFGKITFDNL